MNSVNVSFGCIESKKTINYLKQHSGKTFKKANAIYNPRIGEFGFILENYTDIDIKTVMIGNPRVEIEEIK